MSLVLYPDSDDDGDEQQNQPAERPALAAQPSPIRSRELKRKRADGQTSELPPLPAAFHDLYSINARISTSDNPSLHGGRKRAVPHIEGNWPSHVYLEWIPTRTESETLHSLIKSVHESIRRTNEAQTRPLPVPDITPSLQSALGASLPLHISLSRTLQIKADDREAYLETLASCLGKAAVKPFDIEFNASKWVPNFERNRWFLVLGIEKPPHDELNRLLEACNEASERWGHPGLYTGGKGDGPMKYDPSVKRRKSSNSRLLQVKQELELERVDRSDKFHISIAWNLIEPTPEWIELVTNLDVSKVVKPPQAPFNAVKARIGNAVHNFPLGSGVSTKSGGGMLGLG